MVKPFKADARREEGQLDRLYVTTNMAQCLHNFLRSDPPELKPAGVSLKDKYPYSLEEFFIKKLEEVKARKAEEKDKPPHKKKKGLVSSAELKMMKAVTLKGLGVSSEEHLMEVGKKVVREFGDETVVYISSENYIQKGER